MSDINTYLKGSSSMTQTDADPYLWLEDIDGDRALDWVRARNAETEADLFAEPLFTELRAEILQLLEADDRLVVPSKFHDEVTNFWTDSANRRGLFRRTTWASFRSQQPQWETVLDIDALAAAEGESWVLKGLDRRPSDRRRMLVALSPGGGDATTSREFDVEERRFIGADEDGFIRPLSKGWLSWVDDDTVYAGGDFGPGSTTRSGYSRTVRRWQRGTSLTEAPVVFEVEESDVSASGSVSRVPGYPHHVFQRAVDFFHWRKWILRGSDLVEIDAPSSAMVEVHGPWLIVRPREDWTVGDTVYPAGSLLAADLDPYLAGDRDITVVFAPTDEVTLTGWTWTVEHLLLRLSEHVRTRIEVCTPGSWVRRPLPWAPEVWTLGASPMNSRETDEIMLSGQDFLTPPTIHYVAHVGAEPELIGTAPARFHADGLSIRQYFASSADGTRIPYFVVGPAEQTEGPAPTWLTGYGGFEVSRYASYSGLIGRGWLSRGGVYVLANLRGGGEYGPRWHAAALRENRARVYEDFEAVALDLIDRGITTSRQLGISGGSNGGLLVGNMYVRRPDLFGAVVCQVPLLDMKRYSHLLAGPSWMAEYGDPDDEGDWSFIRTFSPYHLVEPSQSYPPLLLTTSTRDDRVHPAHARKMVARLTELGYDVGYWENIEGGHGGAADAPQQATMWALTLTFLQRHLFG